MGAEMEYKDNDDVEIIDVSEVADDDTEILEVTEETDDAEILEVTEETDDADGLLDIEIEEDDGVEIISPVEAAEAENADDADDQEDEYEESEGVIALVMALCTRFAHSKYSMAAGIAAVIIVVACGTTFALVSRKNKPTVVETYVPQETTTQFWTEEETKAMPLQGMKLEAVADEDSITAKVLDEDGAVLTGHDFVIKLYEGSLETNREKVDKAIQKQKELVSTAEATTEQGSFAGNAATVADTDDADGSVAYNDDDKDGEIVIKNLEAGTYTLMVQAETGFEVPDATEATIVKFEVIENIMEQVVEQSEDTEKEDPQAVREAEVSTVPAVEITTAVPQTQTGSIAATKKQVTVTSVKLDDGNIVYSSRSTDTIYSYSDVSSYITDDNKRTVHLSDGSTITGYVYETGTFKATDEEYSVIKKLLVETNVSAANVTDLVTFSEDAPVRLANEASTTAESKQETSAVNGTASETTASAAEGTTIVQETAAASDSKVQTTTAAASTTQTTTAAASTQTTTAAASTTQTTTAAASTSQTATQTQTATQAGKTYRVVELTVVTEEEVKEVNAGWYYDGGDTYYLEDGKALTGWHWIEGLNYYFNASGKLSSTLVIDVSSYNGSIDWKKVKASGISDVIVRVGYRGWGTARIVRDSKFTENVSGARAAGLNVGAYFVTQAINTAEAVEEASFIVQEARQNGLNLPLAIDVEWAGSGSEQGRGNYLSAGERTAVINAFCETVYNSGYTPMVYASKSWFTNYIYSPGIVSYAQIWVAQYADIDETTYGGRYNMWQFRSDGAVSGISGNVDVSAWVR
jgi:GH25 family lysozyme M1 (1,4-beta-N-acetylmuramidase)